jgi:hypothetical protein
MISNTRTKIKLESAEGRSVSSASTRIGAFLDSPSVGSTIDRRCNQEQEEAMSKQEAERLMDLLDGFEWEDGEAILHLNLWLNDIVHS